MTLSEMYRRLLREQEEARDELEQAYTDGLSWMDGYAQGVSVCVETVRAHLLSEDTEDP